MRIKTRSNKIALLPFGFCLLLFTGIVSAVSPLAAQAYGSKNQKKVGTIARLGLGISLILAIPIALLFYNGGSLLLLLGQDANTAALAQTYLRAIALGFIPALGFAVLKTHIPHPELSQSVITEVNISIGNKKIHCLTQSRHFRK